MNLQFSIRLDFWVHCGKKKVKKSFHRRKGPRLAAIFRVRAALLKRFWTAKKTMNIKKKLSNPFALIAQGFGLGAMLFFATMGADADSPQQPPPVQSAALGKSLSA